MKKQKSFLENGKLISIGLMALALLLFIFANSLSGGLSVFLHILWVLSLGAGIFFLYLGHRQSATQVNYFLYDRRRKKKLKKEELTFQMVEDSLMHYLEDHVKEPLELWQGFPKSLQIQLQAKAAFLPLIVYRMLYGMSALGDEEIIQVFDHAPGRIVAESCKVLKQVGDGEMANVLFKMKRDLQTEEKHVVAFFQKNKKIFEARMIRYILRCDEDLKVDITTI